MTHANPSAARGCAAILVHTLIGLLIVTLAWSAATTTITPLAVTCWTFVALVTAAETIVYRANTRRPHP